MNLSWLGETIVDAHIAFEERFPRAASVLELLVDVMCVLACMSYVFIGILLVLSNSGVLGVLGVVCFYLSVWMAREFHLPHRYRVWKRRCRRWLHEHDVTVGFALITAFCRLPRLDFDTESRASAVSRPLSWSYEVTAAHRRAERLVAAVDGYDPERSRAPALDPDADLEMTHFMRPLDADGDDAGDDRA